MGFIFTVFIYFLFLFYFSDDPITTTSYYRAENMCWLTDYSLYFGFLIIVFIVLLHNIVVLILVCKKLFEKQNVSRHCNLHYYLKGH